MPDFLRLSGVRAGYGETVVLEDIGFSLPERGSLAEIGRASCRERVSDTV